MIIDITGIVLCPGNGGKDCLGNGEQIDEDGHIIECCCDECDYMACCFAEHWPEQCGDCTDNTCPRKEKHTDA